MILKNPINVTHKKIGKEYKIIGCTKNCTNANEGQMLVLYECLTTFRDLHFSREETEFVEKFEIGNNFDRFLEMKHIHYQNLELFPKLQK